MQWACILARVEVFWIHRSEGLLNSETPPPPPLQEIAPPIAFCSRKKLQYYHHPALFVLIAWIDWLWASDSKTIQSITTMVFWNDGLCPEEMRVFSWVMYTSCLWNLTTEHITAKGSKGDCRMTIQMTPFFVIFLHPSFLPFPPLPPPPPPFFLSFLCHTCGI